MNLNVIASQALLTLWILFCNLNLCPKLLHNFLPGLVLLCSRLLTMISDDITELLCLFWDKNHTYLESTYWSGNLWTHVAALHFQGKRVKRRWKQTQKQTEKHVWFWAEWWNGCLLCYLVARYVCIVEVEAILHILLLIRYHLHTGPVSVLLSPIRIKQTSDI